MSEENPTVEAEDTTSPTEEAATEEPTPGNGSEVAPEITETPSEENISTVDSITESETRSIHVSGGDFAAVLVRLEHIERLVEANHKLLVSLNDKFGHTAALDAAVKSPRVGTAPTSPKAPKPASPAATKSIDKKPTPAVNVKTPSAPKPTEKKPTPTTTPPKKDGKEEKPTDKKKDPSKRNSTLNLKPAEEKKEAVNGVKYFCIKSPVYPPSNWDPSSASTAEPSQSLQLEHINGYRGYKHRNNLFYNVNGELVYFAAGTGVVFNKETNTQRFFLSHNDDIACLAMHPNGHIVATGQIGKSPYVCVWDSVTLEQLAILKDFHKNGVDCVGFSKDGTKLVTIGGDNDHMICVYDWKEGKILGKDKGHNDNVFFAQYNWFSDTDNIITGGVKHIKFWEKDASKKKSGIFGKDKQPVNVYNAGFYEDDTVLTGTATGEVYFWKANAVVNTVKVNEGDVRGLFVDKEFVVTGGNDGKVILWDLKMTTQIKTFDVTNENQQQTVVSLDKRGPLILVGTSNNEIIEINSETGEITMHVSGHREEIWGLAVHPTAPHYASSADDKTLRIWDVASKKVVKKVPLESASRCVAYSPDSTLLAVGLNEGGVAIYDSTNYSLVIKLDKDIKKEVSDLKFSPSGDKLAVGSQDASIYIYTTKGWKKLHTLKGHSSRITQLDWSLDGKYILSNSQDYEVLIWDVDGGKQYPHPHEMRDLQYATITCRFAWPLQSIWKPEYNDGTDINNLHVSSDKALIATGDDSGKVNIFKYPAVAKNQKCKTYGGHCSHVTNVRFTFDDSHLISTGGKDLAVMQWRRT